VVPQVLRQPLVSYVALEWEDRVGEFVAQPTTRHGQAMIADLACGMAVAQVQGRLQQFLDPAREPHRAARGILEHLVTATQPVAQALLMAGL
jgi:hypothetical protein